MVPRAKAMTKKQRSESAESSSCPLGQGQEQVGHFGTLGGGIVNWVSVTDLPAITIVPSRTSSVSTCEAGRGWSGKKRKRPTGLPLFRYQVTSMFDDRAVSPMASRIHCASHTQAAQPQIANLHGHQVHLLRDQPDAELHRHHRAPEARPVAEAEPQPVPLHRDARRMEPLRQHAGECPVGGTSSRRRSYSTRRP